MSRSFPLILSALACLVHASVARAERFEDLGAVLGLPTGSVSGTALVAAISAGDVDGDGDLDLFVTMPNRGVNLYLRDGAVFSSGGHWLPLIPSGETQGHTLFDMDGDGDLDLYLARDDGDLLWENTGTRWVDVTASRLPHLVGESSSATAADFDGDGDLDLLVARYIDRIEFPMHRCLDNRLLENDGNGRFRDVTRAAGLDQTRGCSFSMVAFDMDGDLDLDLITINDFAQFVGPTELWENQGRDALGQWRFREVGVERGLVAPVYGMGTAIEDFDQDGRLDLFITNIGEALLFTLDPVTLMLQNVAFERGVNVRFASDRNQVTWTARAEDLDRDGYLDILAAGGNLPAAPFIGNPNEQRNVWLRGQPDGRLVTAPLDIAFPGGDSSVRDFELVDIDGDQRPEILAAHVTGRVSVLKDRSPTPLPTTLELVPRYTGASAAGAVVTLHCGASTRTRHLSAGGDYGNFDHGVVRFAFPPPCQVPDLPVSGEVRWPSGFRQALELKTGTSMRIEEVAWLSLDQGFLDVDLSAHLGSADVLELDGPGITIAAFDAVGARHWRASLEGEGQLDLRVDGVLWGAHPRLAVRTPQIWFDPPTPVAGRPSLVTVRFPDDLAVEVQGKVGATDFALVRTAACLWQGVVAMPASAGDSELALERAGHVDYVGFRVAEPISLARSELVVRDLVVTQADVSSKRLRLRMRLLDDNGDSSLVPMQDLRLRVDGVPREPDERLVENQFQTLVLFHPNVSNGSRIEVLVRDQPLFQAVTARQLASPDELGPIASAATSRCFFSEPRLRADGQDRGTVLIIFLDATGQRLPDLGLRPIFAGEGLSVVQSSVEAAYGGWSATVVAGPEPRLGRLTATLPGMNGAVTCTLPLVERPLLPPPIAGSPIESIPLVPTIGSPITFRFWPHGADHRGLGSGVPLFFSVVGPIDGGAPALYASPSYAGFGRYEIRGVPIGQGVLAVTVLSGDGRVLAETSVTIGREAGPVDAEPGPELVEVVEPVDASDAEAEVVEDEDAHDPGPDVADPDVDPDAVGGDVAEAHDPDTQGPHDDTRDAPDLAGPADAHDATQDTTTLPDPEPAPDDTRGRDGCGGSAPSSLSALALASLALIARRRHAFWASIRRCR
jgi:hypothetical protein